MTSQRKSMVNTQYGRSFVLLSCELFSRFSYKIWPKRGAYFLQPSASANTCISPYYGHSNSFRMYKLTLLNPKLLFITIPFSPFAEEVWLQYPFTLEQDATPSGHVVCVGRSVAPMSSSAAVA